MSSQQPSAVDLLVSSEVSLVSGGDERWPVAQAVKFAEIEKSLRELRSGRMIVIADDEDRENEGDLMIAAETTPADDPSKGAFNNPATLPPEAVFCF